MGVKQYLISVCLIVNDVKQLMILLAICTSLKKYLVKIGLLWNLGQDMGRHAFLSGCSRRQIPIIFMSLHCCHTAFGYSAVLFSFFSLFLF